MTPTPSLAPHHQRVIAEHDALHANMDRLRAFTGTETFDRLPLEDQDLLILQLGHMQNYADILQRRIDRFAPPDIGLHESAPISLADWGAVQARLHRLD